WLVRGSIAPGESGLMYEAVKSLSLPAGRTFAWCAGETLTIAPIRRCLRRDLGPPKEDVKVVGYWRKMPSTPGETRAAEDSALGRRRSRVRGFCRSRRGCSRRGRE